MVVEIRGFRKEFKSALLRKRLVAVKGLSMEIAEGEVYGLIGPNGAGKSTTMKALLGLLQPSAGECRVFGHDASKVDARHQVGYLPENPYFFKHQTARETLEFYGKLCGLRGGGLKARVQEMLDLVRLADAAERRLSGFSKGMLQRIGLAQALIQDPKLLVLDEPTAGVDPIGSREIRDLILSLKGRGVTVFLCSHLLEQVQEVCDRVGVIYEGEMVVQGSVDSLCGAGDEVQLSVGGLDDAGLQSLRRWIVEQGGSVEAMARRERSLESVFIDVVTQRKGGHGV
ncbi:ABC transporter ATP-binding protein [Rubritalea marina]|uniref:ABC transporter ATP-binding protein n=1 Tax=Rubritalea marina TaxID=361055 RepID=UPI00035F0BEF|nr:ABC transporter ATP-binding protein [Rubritalea marina]